MKLAFVKGYYDIDNPEIQNFPVEYEPQTIKEAWDYIAKHRTTSYYNVSFDFNKAPVLLIDYGSWSEFCYLWDLTKDNQTEFFGEDDKENEEDPKKDFARDVLNDLKQRSSLTYEEAVAIHKILGGN